MTLQVRCFHSGSDKRVLVCCRTGQVVINKSSYGLEVEEKTHGGDQVTGAKARADEVAALVFQEPPAQGVRITIFLEDLPPIPNEPDLLPYRFSWAWTPEIEPDKIPKTGATMAFSHIRRLMDLSQQGPKLAPSPIVLPPKNKAGHSIKFKELQQRGKNGRKR